MSSTLTEQVVVSVAPPRDTGVWTDRSTSIGRYLRRNPTLMVGLLIIILFPEISLFLPRAAGFIK